MKKQEIARENIFSSVGRVTVAVYLKADTDKQTLSTVLFSNKSKFVPGISAQMTYRPGRGRTLEESVKNVIARTVAKYETACRPQRKHIDYAQAYGYLPGDVKHQLCPAQWRAENTRRAALTYYERRSIPILQRILDRIDDPSTLEEAQQAYLHWLARTQIVVRQMPSQPQTNTLLKRICYMRRHVICCHNMICPPLRFLYLQQRASFLRSRPKPSLVTIWYGWRN